ncbi:hypothetical protein NLI96_g4750 [Meripilus lineatus]|uniref:Uncharacterized protein n=1 Tax=Meripilus lineatus TaxID=2056292 RepID=A0AAD5YJT4_9APHY|nr:hypothetical protein NLI96_g4750 [Physisporinus lineatus]
MATLGFSHTSKGGSAVAYKAPEWSSLKPFRVHRSHTSQMEPWQVLGVRKNISKNLDWKLEQFSDERCPGQDPRNHPHLYGPPEASNPPTTARKKQDPNNSRTRRFTYGSKRNSEVSKN